jgi:uncharacterized protein
MSTMQNPFIWHDLMTSDAEAAKKFYGAVVGWTFTNQMPTYSVASANGVGVGGVMDTPAEMKGMPSVWTGYVYTPDVDATCKEVIKLGGKIYKEAWDIPNVGRLAVIGDPTGSGLMIMQPFPTQERDMPKPGALGTVGWNELHAGDLNIAWDFYSKLFGWTKGGDHDMGPKGNYRVYQIDGKDAGGMMKKMDTMPMPTWVYYFVVDGMDRAVVRIAKVGGKIAFGPMEVPGGQWTVHGVDPQGARFSLLSNTK